MRLEQPGQLLPMLLIVLALAAGAHAERAVEVIRPAHRLAEELVPIAQAILGEEGTATADRATNSLVLVGSRAAVVGGIGQRLDAGQRGSRVLSTNYRSEERVFLLRVEID